MVGAFLRGRERAIFLSLSARSRFFRRRVEILARKIDASFSQEMMVKAENLFKVYL